jgi:hypothetical protein
MRNPFRANHDNDVMLVEDDIIDVIVMSHQKSRDCVNITLVGISVMCQTYFE